jgi:hypothetical protein
MAKVKATAKRSAKSPAKSRRRQRNAGGDQTLSSDPIAKNAMRKRTKRTPKEPAPQPAQAPAPAGTDRVIAECNNVDAALDRVAAALIELTRTERAQDLPPLTITEVDIANGQAGGQRGWAVVSDDPQMPLTEAQAREIVAAMQSLLAPATIGIAAE